MHSKNMYLPCSGSVRPDLELLLKLRKQLSRIQSRLCSLSMASELVARIFFSQGGDRGGDGDRKLDEGRR